MEEKDIIILTEVLEDTLEEMVRIIGKNKTTTLALAIVNEAKGVKHEQETKTRTKGD